METMTHGFEGKESDFESKILNRGIKLSEHKAKMDNLEKLAADGHRIIRAIRHDKYTVEGYNKYYNPYTDEWYGDIRIDSLHNPNV